MKNANFYYRTKNEQENITHIFRGRVEFDKECEQDLFEDLSDQVGLIIKYTPNICNLEDAFDTIAEQLNTYLLPLDLKVENFQLIHELESKRVGTNHDTFRYTIEQLYWNSSNERDNG